MSNIKRPSSPINTVFSEDEIKLRLPTTGRCYILIEPDPLPEKKGSLYLPDEHRERPEDKWWWGTVRQVPRGHYNERGRLILPDVKPGDRVYYDRNTGAEGDPLGCYGLAEVPEEAIVAKVPEEGDERDQDGDVEFLG